MPRSVSSERIDGTRRLNVAHEPCMPVRAASLPPLRLFREPQGRARSPQRSGYADKFTMDRALPPAGADGAGDDRRDASESGRGLPHSKTLSRVLSTPGLAQVPPRRESAEALARSLALSEHGPRMRALQSPFA